MQVRFPWGKKPALVYPVPPAPPTAILVEGFRSTANVRVFEGGWAEEVLSFAPAAIAATPEQLKTLRGIRIPSLVNALIALVRPGDRSLTEEDREQLWRAFRVPLFEQRIGDRCQLLAFECEAHDGLHVQSQGLAPRTGEAIESAPCGCGRTSPRIVSPERVENLRKVAAYAR